MKSYLALPLVIVAGCTEYAQPIIPDTYYGGKITSAPITPLPRGDEPARGDGHNCAWDQLCGEGPDEKEPPVVFHCQDGCFFTPPDDEPEDEPDPETPDDNPDTPSDDHDADRGKGNNGFGNGDQDAPGNSEHNNNAENAGGNRDGMSDAPGNSGHENGPPGHSNGHPGKGKGKH